MSLLSPPKNVRSQCYACIAMSTCTLERGKFAKQVKRYILRSKPCSRDFISCLKTKIKSWQIMWRPKTSTCIRNILVVVIKYSLCHTLPAS